MCILTISICIVLFLSTLSLRRATHPVTVFICVIEDFYPRSPCGERLFRQNYECFEWIISIHALLAESDLNNINSSVNTADISIHALLAESDLTPARISSRLLLFLSTLSLRRATRRSVKLFRQNYISIHALLAESDEGSKP